MMEKILGCFPACCWGFAYGSGVFLQIGYSEKNNPLIDIIMVVDDPTQWHFENIAMNPSHYSSLKLFGADAVAKVQICGMGKVYFNTDVSLHLEDGVQVDVKYGVIGKADLLRDLSKWEFLYTSGRLHKPVLFLEKPDLLIKEALDQNLLHAMHVSCLLLNDSTFSDVELFRTISRISYAGDIRMAFAENPRKVDNIVLGNLPQFRNLYSRFLQDSPPASFLGNIHKISEDTFRVAINDDRRSDILNSLPITSLRERKTTNTDILSSLQSLVRHSSRHQTVKGVLTAGPTKAFFYSMKKIAKRFL